MRIRDNSVGIRQNDGLFSIKPRLTENHPNTLIENGGLLTPRAALSSFKHVVNRQKPGFCRFRSKTGSDRVSEGRNGPSQGWGPLWAALRSLFWRKNPDKSVVPGTFQDHFLDPKNDPPRVKSDPNSTPSAGGDPLEG